MRCQVRSGRCALGLGCTVTRVSIPANRYLKMAARRGSARVLARATLNGSQAILDSKDRHRSATGGREMTQTRITKPRTSSARRRDKLEQPSQLDPRDPDIVRAKQLQRRPRQPSATRRAR